MDPDFDLDERESNTSGTAFDSSSVYCSSSHKKSSDVVPCLEDSKDYSSEEFSELSRLSVALYSVSPVMNTMICHPKCCYCWQQPILSIFSRIDLICT